MFKTAKGEWAKRVGKKIGDAVIKHPRTTLGVGGAATGSGMGYGQAKLDNWADTVGRSEKDKKRMAKGLKTRTKQYTIAGGIAGGALGALQGHAITRHPNYKSVRDRVVSEAKAKSHVPGWAKGKKTKKDVKSSFREQARAHHPDRGGSEEKMKNLNKEWEDFEKSDHFKKMSSLLPSFWDELARINP
jgi:hypothetical protein